jgi:unsaturated chondroitin disaccharide hydrolase
MNQDVIISSAIHKIERTAKEIKEGFPHLTERGHWKTTHSGSWTGGFWIGVLWQAYFVTKDEKFQKFAYKWMSLLEPRKKDKIFDLSFLFYPSFVLGYKITGDGKLRKVALEAADTLAGISQVESGFICQEVLEGEKKYRRTAIDVMMDLPLLWWAHDETNDKKYYDAAYKHAIKTLENLINDNRPAVHTVDLDIKTGKIVRRLTSHGYAHNSGWSRGQAWSIYGFTLAYNATKEKTFLDTAEKLADYFIKNLPADYVPYWDFSDPNIPNVVKDSSAAVIACSGLITLHKLSKKPRLKEVANKILGSLCANYIAEESQDGILTQGCFDFPKRIGVNESLIWGDYYFLEALLKMKVGELLSP